MFGRLLGMASLGNSLASVGLMSRFLSTVTKTVILAIICAFLFCGIIASVIVMFYVFMVSSGMNPFLAAIILGGIVILILALLIAIILDNIRYLRSWLYRQPRNLSHAAAAFIEGFLCSKKK